MTSPIVEVTFVDEAAKVFIDVEAETDANADVADGSEDGPLPAEFAEGDRLLVESNKDSAFDMLAEVADQRSLVENAVRLALARSFAC